MSVVDISLSRLSVPQALRVGVLTAQALLVDGSAFIQGKCAHSGKGRVGYVAVKVVR
jgi:hypothetical protein